MKLVAHIVVAGIALAVTTATVRAAVTAPRLPRAFCAAPHALADAKASLADGDSKFNLALQQLLTEAKRALAMKPVSVMDKSQIPPSGDKHDFVSQAPYFWRDTNSPGVKYIHRDGQRNPESGDDPDAGHLGKVCANAHTLALAFYFTGEEKYAAKATEIIRVWFLNPATRMNPNLNYGQGIPDEVEGRPEGLISARGLVGLMDAIGLLGGSKSWTPADQRAITEWVGKYFEWLTTNKLALREGNATNNHGTYYDTQVVALAMFLGKTNVARNLLLKDRENRIARQIEPDGRQPRELTRTLSFNYSLFNLRALFDLASLGRNAGVDLWHYQSADGRCILKAVKFLAVYADPAKPWPYQQIHPPNRDDLMDILLRASAIYPSSQLGVALKFYPAGKLAKNQIQLLYAAPPTR